MGENEAPRNDQAQAHIMLASLGLGLVVVSLAVLISYELRGVNDARAVGRPHHGNCVMINLIFS